MAEQAQERFARIRRDPERALFSEYRGTSQSGAVTVWVDMIGKLSRVHIAPNTLYEGGEMWLTEEIASAYDAAKRAAEVLDFSMADLVQELDAAPALKERVSTTSPQRWPDPPPDDESFENRTVLR